MQIGCSIKARTIFFKKNRQMQAKTCLDMPTQVTQVHFYGSRMLMLWLLQYIFIT
jgi:hypothetical protein